MDVSSLRLDTLNIRVEPCKQFNPPEWAVPGNSADTGAALHVIKSGEVVDTLKIDDSRLYTLFGRCPSGTEPSGVSVVLEHPSVSRVHAAVLRGKENLIYIIDLGSSHGTFVSGKRIEPFSAVALHNRSVVVFGQSTRRYIVRVFPKNVASCMDAEEANTLINCMVSYKEQEDDSDKLSIDEMMFPPLGKMERRVSFSILAPEIIPVPASRPTPPAMQDGPTTPMAIMGGSPEMNWFRKQAIPTSPRLILESSSLPQAIPRPQPSKRHQGRSKSDSLPSIQANSGSDEDDYASLESLEMSPILGTIDETNVVVPQQSLVAGPTPTAATEGRKNFFKRFPAKVEAAFAKRVRSSDN